MPLTGLRRSHLVVLGAVAGSRGVGAPVAAAAAAELFEQRRGPWESTQDSFGSLYADLQQWGLVHEVGTGDEGEHEAARPELAAKATVVVTEQGRRLWETVGRSAGRP